MTEWILLEAAEDVTDEMLGWVDDLVEGWYQPETEPLVTEDFIDDFCQKYLPAPYDIERLDTPAVAKIMRRARQTRKEMA